MSKLPFGGTLYLESRAGAVKIKPEMKTLVAMLKNREQEIARFISSQRKERLVPKPYNLRITREAYDHFLKETNCILRGIYYRYVSPETRIVKFEIIREKEIKIDK